MKDRCNLSFVTLALLCLFTLVSCKSDKLREHNSSVFTNDANSTRDLFTIRYRPKWHTQAQFAGIYIALEKGFYAQHGLNVQIQELLQSHDALDSLVAGKTDIVHLDLLHALEHCRDSTKIVNIGQITQKNSLLLIGKRSRGINSIEDFKGKKIGLWRSASFLISKIFMNKLQIPMKVIDIDWSINLFTQNAVDVINAMHYNEYHQMLQAGIKEEDLFVVDVAEFGLSIPDEGLYVTPSFYKSHPKECEAFAKATMDGWLYAFSHINETLDVVLKRMQADNLKANRAHQQWMLEGMKEAIAPTKEQLGWLKRTDFNLALNALVEYNNFPRNIRYEEFFPYGVQK